MWKMTYDIHTHTTFSHGKGSMEDNVKAAIEKGLSAVAISDHGPGHINYGFTKTDIPIPALFLLCYWFLYYTV